MTIFFKKTKLRVILFGTKIGGRVVKLIFRRQAEGMSETKLDSIGEMFNQDEFRE